MKVYDHETKQLQEVDTSKTTAGALKPTPEYSVLFERTVLDDSFVLSTISNTATVLDLWKTHPYVHVPKTAPPSEHVQIDGCFPLRDLGENIDDTGASPLVTPTQDIISFATIAKMSVDSLMEPEKSYITEIRQHTPFSIVPRVYPFQVAPPYIGNTITVTLKPKELGDLLSFMYFSCDLPAVSADYCSDLGRALFSKVEMYLDGQLIDWYDDDWSVIHDEIFMDASERLVLDQVLNGPDTLIVPLLFFFCKKGTYLPLCAIQNQTIYIKFYFRPQGWFTNYDGQFDIVNPTLVFDQIFLGSEERTDYMTTPLDITIPVIYRETPAQFTNGTVNINMTPNFNVTMLAWFIRNQNYETLASEYPRRYSYGYVSDTTKSYTNFINWRGTSQKYLQTIETVDIFVNNTNIIKGMAGDIYFKYTQPIQHGLSIPDRDICTYCFSKNPKNLKTRGEINFSDYSSKTTNLRIQFLASLVPQLTQSYTLYIYYYGYAVLSIQNGFGVIHA
jgi:hypothetical protein